MLNSLLSSEIADYIRLRYAFVSVSTANADEKVLDDLDEFLVKAEVTDKELTEEILTDFIATLTGKSKTIYNKVGTIRGFTRFLNALGYTAFIPDVPTVKSDFMPYIYSNEEIQKGLWAKIPADGHTTLTKPYLAGQSEDGKNIWKDEKTTVSNRELKSMVEFYKKDLVPKYDIPEL